MSHLTYSFDCPELLGFEGVASDGPNLGTSGLRLLDLFLRLGLKLKIEKNAYVRVIVFDNESEN